MALPQPGALVKRVEVGVTPEHGFGKAGPARGRARDVRVIFGLFGRSRERRAPVDALFARLAEASRQPALYRSCGVPDTFEGRFESLTLHLFLLLRRLRDLPAPAADLSQELVDACFAYLELGFRNGGVSDIAVPKRMKKIGQSLYGRLKAYEAALDEPGPEALIEALRRNVGAGEGAEQLARYALDSAERLAGRDLAAILSEDQLFPTLTAGETRHDA